MNKLIRYLPVVLVLIMLSAAASATVNYVNHDNPLIKLGFQEEADIKGSVLDESQIPFSPEGFNTEFSYQSEINAEGDHKLVIDAENQKGETFEESPFTYVFYLDKTPITLASSSPAKVETVTLDGELTISLVFSEPVDFDKFTYTFRKIGSSEDITVIFAQSSSDTIEGAVAIADNGEYTLIITTSDAAGNSGTEEITFNIIKYLEIAIAEPAGGYSSITPFDVSFNTNLAADCKFYLDATKNKNLNSLDEAYFNEFSTTGSMLHEQSGFNVPDNQKLPLFVLCKAKEHDFEKREKFDLIVDTTSPIITVQSSDIAGLPLLSKIFVDVDDKSLCRYSQENQDFEDMSIITLDYEKHFEIRGVVSDETSYVYYIACKNRAGLTSITSTSFAVNTKVDLDVDIVEPSQTYYANKSHKIKATTNKNSQCYYSTNNEDFTSFGSGRMNHIKSAMNFDTGSTRIYVKCVASTTLGSAEVIESKEIVIDTTPPTDIEVDDEQPNEEDGSVWNNKKVKVEVGAVDDESGINEYAYRVRSNSGNYSSGWIYETSNDVSIKENSDGDRLNLTYQKSYYVEVKVKNNAGLWSTVVESDGFYLDAAEKPDVCENEKFDYGDETDIDCGGKCESCGEGKSCVLDGDCETGYCEDKVCKKVSCYDNLKNGDETDVDCGGSQCNKCSASGKCQLNRDCESEVCKMNSCFTPDPCNNGKKDSGEADIDCGGVCSTKCLNYRNCNQGSDCVTGACENSVCKTKATSDAVDTDGDGISDDVDEDDDNDSIPDVWELANGLNPQNANDANLQNKEGMTYTEQYLEEIRKKTTKGGGGVFLTILLIMLLILVGGGAFIYFKYPGVLQSKFGGGKEKPPTSFSRVPRMSTGPGIKSAYTKPLYKGTIASPPKTPLKPTIPSAKTPQKSPTKPKTKAAKPLPKKNAVKKKPKAMDELMKRFS